MEVLKVLKMDYHSVVGSGNYWVTFVAHSHFVLIRCLWALILKAVCFSLLLMPFRKKKNVASKVQNSNRKLGKYLETFENSLF